ncbi:transcriptional regulator GcvA [Kiloniella laminariae]|uniref:Transcriptional regulator GcvA n=1 Tax=Kiloniella laminariae TaxID=454162 RepID=A0ABT4LNU0_9PROT|nr:transcriptional regulator GcvA [Kiloniella laminariae]MCZ4282778.1 transcriptional regulator GcvA [Kiloniella laminariae]
MYRYVPSLTALRTFESSARHMSFTKAAEELNVTQSAVSRQIRQLEDELGIRLFERVRQRLVLTEAGASYVEEVRSGLNHLKAATLNLLAYQGVGGELLLACLPTFGSRWLIPRLGRFTSQHPEINVNLITRIEAFNFDSENIDAAIHFGDANWPGAITDKLMGEEMIPVCNPTLMERGQGLHTPNDLRHHTLLQLRSRPYAWQEWLKGADAQDINPAAGPKFEQFHMIINAALSGLGIALLPAFLIREELSKGLLIQPFEHSIRGKNAYYLVYPEKKRGLPRLQTFRRWLLREASKHQSE